MRKFWLLTLIPWIILFFPLHLYGQEEKEGYKLLKTSQEDIPVEVIEEKTSITGTQQVLSRDAPATVSVLTEEDILRSGSRDLMDVLRMIPGFEFGTDVQGVTCLGIRGNSANEGGLLVLVDGMEMTDILYASNNFGSIYPIDQIKKIEVIRGPGSVLYGGFAVYAVISITTRAGTELNGFHVASTVGEATAGSQRRNISASFGAVYEKCSFSLTTGVSSANRSDGVYTDNSGKTVNLTESSLHSDRFISARFRRGNLLIKALADVYQIQNRTNLGLATSKPYTTSFVNTNLEFQYDFKLNTRLTVRPYLSIRRQNPWQMLNEIEPADSSLVFAFHTHALRLNSGLKTEWRIHDNFELSGGLGFWRENSTDVIYGNEGLNSSFYCFTSYLQGNWKNEFVNCSFGSRFDYHNYYKPILSPRISLIKPMGRHYLKFSYNRSFRTPAIANIVYKIDSAILPQKTDYFDLEYGVRIGSHFSAAVNLYQIGVRDGIIYEIRDAVWDGYSNGGRFGTRGMEAQFTFRNNHGAVINSSWSYYHNSMKNPGGNFVLPGSRLNLAYPAHKVCFNAGFPVSERITVNGTMHFITSRYGFNGQEDNPQYIDYGPALQWNIYIDFKDVFIRGLHLGAGVFDLTDSRYALIQPYRSFHLPVSGLSREFTFRIAYGLNSGSRQ
jgi:outer membrane receptor for ferrienterochelin and colicin